jgi:hypothetical protein
VPCEFAPEKLAARPADAARLRELFRRWGFRGMLEALPVEKQAELI